MVGFMQHTNYVDPVFQQLYDTGVLSEPTAKGHPEMYRSWPRYFQPLGKPEVII